MFKKEYNIDQKELLEEPSWFAYWSLPPVQIFICSKVATITGLDVACECASMAWENKGKNQQGYLSNCFS